MGETLRHIFLETTATLFTTYRGEANFNAVHDIWMQWMMNNPYRCWIVLVFRWKKNEPYMIERRFHSREGKSRGKGRLHELYLTGPERDVGSFLMVSPAFNHALQYVIWSMHRLHHDNVWSAFFCGSPAQYKDFVSPFEHPLEELETLIHLLRSQDRCFPAHWRIMKRIAHCNGNWVVEHVFRKKLGSHLSSLCIEDNSYFALERDAESDADSTAAMPPSERSFQTFIDLRELLYYMVYGE